MADTSVPIKDANNVTRNIDAHTQADGDYRQGMVVGDAVTTATVAVATDGGLLTGARDAGGFLPEPAAVLIESDVNGRMSLTADKYGALYTRGAVMTDEGSFRDDFSGTSLDVSLGTATFTNGSTSVTGTGFSTMRDLNRSAYVKKATDLDSVAVPIAEVVSNTELRLATAYTGTTATVAGVYRRWLTDIVGSASQSVATSFLTLTTGTVLANEACVYRLGDFAPLKGTWRVNSISQRIVNQSFEIGFSDDPMSTSGDFVGAQGATVVFDGTDATKCKFRTYYSAVAADAETTTVTIPNGSNTSVFHVFELEVTGLGASLTVDGILLATHVNHVPDPYATMSYFSQARVITGAAASSSTISVDSIAVQNVDQLNVTNSFRGEIPLRITQTDRTGAAASFRADQHLNVTGDPTTLLFDNFEALNTIDTWTLSGTVIPTLTTGNLSADPGTAANATSYLTSKPLFYLPTTGFLRIGQVLTFNAATITGNKRFWGLGVLAGAPTPAIPLANGIVFEIGTDGNLYGAVYSSSVRTQSVSLIRPVDGLAHRYAIFFRSSRAYFEIDSNTVGTIATPNPNVSSMPVVVGSINDTTVVATAPTLSTTLCSVGDTARNNVQLSDPFYQWRKPFVTDPAMATGGLVRAAREQWAGPALNTNPNAIQFATYNLVGKPAATALVANTVRSFVSLHHTAAATRTIRIRRVKVSVLFSGVIQACQAEIHRIATLPVGTAWPANGTTAGLTATDGRDGASEAVGLLLPSTITMASLLDTAFVGSSTVAQLHGGGAVVYDWQESGQAKPITLRAGVLEGISVGLTSSAAVTATATIEIQFTEE